MTTVASLLEALGRIAPWSKAAAWDPVGLQLGDPAAEVGRLAVCHEVTEAVLARMESDPVELLITYHPLLFRPLRSLVAGPGPGGRAWRLARAGTAVAAVHTNFDAAPGGTGDALADALDLVDVTRFGGEAGPDSVKIVTFVPAGSVDQVTTAMADAGGGVVGNYHRCSFRTAGEGTFFAGEGTDPVAGTAGAFNREPEIRLEMTAPSSREQAVVTALVAAHPYEEPAFDVYDRRGDLGMIGRVGQPARESTLGELAGRTAGALGVGALRVAGSADRAVERVAVVPGSGASLIEEAAATGADVLITGDVSHHRAVEAAGWGLAVVDPGHAATERPGVRRLYASVAELGLPAVDLTDVDPTPWSTWKS